MPETEPPREPLTSSIHVVLTEAQRARIYKVAEHQDMSVSTWARRVLIAELRRLDHGE